MKNNLIDIGKYRPALVIDQRYASNHNVMGRVIYDHNIPRLLFPVALALNKVGQRLAGLGYQLVVWDAYRPPRVQQLLRQYCSDEQYVTKVSNHSKGIAVDVTILQSKTGEYLDMGTDFDEFNQKAHSNYPNLTDTQLKNRQLLKSNMIAEKFVQLPSEWWHFDYQPLLGAEVIDLDKQEVLK